MPAIPLKQYNASIFAQKSQMIKKQDEGIRRVNTPKVNKCITIPVFLQVAKAMQAKETGKLKGGLAILFLLQSSNYVQPLPPPAGAQHFWSQFVEVFAEIGLYLHSKGASALSPVL
jgi:hypothetical protein